MNYKEQYKHPKWQKKRLEILTRDGYHCVNCGNNENTLHVHHYYYTKDAKVWEYENEALTTLCDDCHEDWHDVNDEIKKLFCVDTTTLREFHDLIELTSDFCLSDMMQIRKIIEGIRKMKTW